MPGKRHIIVVAYTFPPVKGIGGRRWAKFAKGLAQKGYRVEVIHCAPDNGTTGSFWSQDIVHPNITAHALPRRYPGVLTRRPLRSLWEKAQYHFWIRALPIIARGNALDKTIFWRDQLSSKIKELRSAHGIRHVIVTGAPFRLMAFVAAMREEDPTMHLSIDFRDPWTWGEIYGQSSLSERDQAFERSLEHQAISQADKVLSPAPAILDELRHSHPTASGKFVCLPHAVDPDELRGSAIGKLASKGVQLIYAGSTYDSAAFTIYFNEVLNAFARCGNKASRFDLFVSGDEVSGLQRMIAAAGLEDRIVARTGMPIQQLTPMISQADAVLVFMPEAKKDFISTKFSELLYLQRPIIHVGPEGGLSRYVTGNSLGLSMRVHEVGEKLPAILDGLQPIPYDPKINADDLLLDPLTDRLVNEVLQ